MRGLSIVLLLSLYTSNLHAAVQTKTVEYKQGDQVLEGYLAWDDAVPGQRPGVLVVHEWTGLGDYVKMRCRKLAEMGYVAFAADIYGKGIRPETPQEAGAIAGKFKKDQQLMRARVTRRAGRAPRQSDVRSEADRGHRLLFRRHVRAGTGPQRGRRGRRRQFPRRPGHAEPGRRQEHPRQGAGAARRRRSARSAQGGRGLRGRDAGRRASIGSSSPTAGPSMPSPTRPPAATSPAAPPTTPRPTGGRGRR